MTSVRRRVTVAFADRYGRAPAFLVRAPGRVNLIGEHTDYNDGFVLPMAIDRAVWIALVPRQQNTVQVYSLDFSSLAEFELDSFQNEGGGWAEYVRGVAWALQSAGYDLAGWDGVVGGDVPRGAGLSSSAALELATARAFAVAGGWEWDAAAMARLCQQAENEWVGVNCGIMDQMISAAGKANHALLIDCRSLATEAVPLPAGTAVIVLDTATRRGLVDSAYNERRRQCEAAAAHFGVFALRDISVTLFEAHSPELDEVTRRRARHVITENERTLAAVAALHRGNGGTMGQLMNASHASLREDFEVSSPELDTMVEIAQNHPGCYGARMTGAGFGGCAVALVHQDCIEKFGQAIADGYFRATGLQARIYVCAATDGASIVG